jgi:hypothetical protein
MHGQLTDGDCIGNWSYWILILVTESKNYGFISQIARAYTQVYSVCFSLHFTSLHFTSLHFTDPQQSSDSYLTSQLFCSSNCRLKTDYTTPNYTQTLLNSCELSAWTGRKHFSQQYFYFWVTQPSRKPLRTALLLLRQENAFHLSFLGGGLGTAVYGSWLNDVTEFSGRCVAAGLWWPHSLCLEQICLTPKAQIHVESATISNSFHSLTSGFNRRELNMQSWPPVLTTSRDQRRFWSVAHSNHINLRHGSIPGMNPCVWPANMQHDDYYISEGQMVTKSETNTV